MSLRLNVDVNELLANKWAWIVSGVFLTILGCIYPNFKSGLEFLDETISSLSPIITFIGIFLLVVGIVWWIGDNWDRIQKELVS